MVLTQKAWIPTNWECAMGAGELIPCVDRAPQDWRTHRVDWIWLQTLRTVFTCRRLGGACWGDGTHRYFSSSATGPSLPGSRLEPGQFKDCEGQLFATFEAVKSYCPSCIFFPPWLHCALRLRVPQGAIPRWGRAVRHRSGLTGLRHTAAKNQSTQASGPIWDDISRLLSGSVCLYLCGT